MKIAIVDDQIKDINELSKMIIDEFEKFDINIEKFDFFNCGEDFLCLWQPGKYEVLILDIFMKDLSGVDVAMKIRELDNEVKLVFITASNEFASESYMVNASFYLKKKRT